VDSKQWSAKISDQHEYASGPGDDEFLEMEIQLQASHSEGMLCHASKA
jgi:hypothetical protein